MLSYALKLSLDYIYTYIGIVASIRIGREIKCLPYVGFLFFIYVVFSLALNNLNTLL